MENQKDAILALAEQFITIPSTHDNPAALEQIIAIAENALSEFTTETFTANKKKSLLIHNAKPGTKKFKIIFNAHLDVVGGSKSQYIAKIDDARLYGRGAYDMKAAAAVMITLFNNIARDVSYPLAIQITTDEETGSFGTEQQVAEGIRGEFIITGECGSNFHITNQAKGAMHVKLTAKGTTAHGAYPWRGDNAVVKLMNTLSTVHAHYPVPEDEARVTTVNIARLITNNKATNKVPSKASAYMDIRYLPEDKDIIEKIKALLPKGVSLEIVVHYVPLDTPEDNKYIAILQEVGKKLYNKPFPFRHAHATSDLVKYARTGCEGIEFGPIGFNQHAKHEWVDIKSLTEYYTILQEFLLAIDKK